MQGQDSSTESSVIQLLTWPVAAGASFPRISKQKHVAEPVRRPLPAGISPLPVVLTTAPALRSLLRVNSPTTDRLPLVASSEFDSLNSDSAKGSL